MLISVAGLLTLGNRQISSGAHTSSALVVAQSIVEALELDGYRQIYAGLGCDATLHTCRVGSGHATVGDWHALASLPAPLVEIRIDAVGASSLDTAPALRVTVAVSWREGHRSRRLRLTTLRV